MHVICPKCNTKFVVNSDKIGIAARKVKCSQCQNIWHYKPENSKDLLKQENYRNIQIESSVNSTIEKVENPRVPEISNSVNLPALMPVRVQPYLYVIPIILVSMVIFLSIMLFPNNIGLISQFNHHNLSITDMNINYNKKDNKMNLSYKISNNSSIDTLSVSTVRIRFLSQNNKVLKTITERVAKTDIKPQGFIQINREFLNPPSSLYSVEIMLGNKIDFLIR